MKMNSKLVLLILITQSIQFASAATAKKPGATEPTKAPIQTIKQNPVPPTKTNSLTHTWKGYNNPDGSPHRIDGPCPDSAPAGTCSEQQ